jgi:T-complex protein 1 subunit beta
MQGFDPSNPLPRVMHEGAHEMKGADAKLTTIIGAMAVADVVKTTLGPKGMDKIILTLGKHGTVTVTNDGATILKRLTVENPAAKILVDISKSQDDEIGDGTTTVCVLAGQLLHEAEALLDQNIHPQTIIAGWRLALQVAKATLEKKAFDNSGNEEQFKKTLFKIAKTTLSSKIVRANHDHFANLALEAVLRLKGSGDLERIQIIKKAGGNMGDSYLEDGFILNKHIGVGCPRRLENATILVANTPMDTDKIKIYGAKVKTDSVAKVAEIEKAEVGKMMKKCQKIVDHGINCFINRQLIYNKPEQFFAEHKVMAIEHADFDGIERLAFVLGADIVSTFDTPESVRLGSCALIDEVMIGEDRLIRFSGCKSGEACTIIMRGSSQHVLDEAERSLHDALCVLVTAVKDPRAVYGGGCCEVAMAEKVDELAKVTPGKKALAIESFARALRSIPKILADNGGYDSAELVSQLRAAQVQGAANAGLNMSNGTIGDMEQLGVTESYKSKNQSLTSATGELQRPWRLFDRFRWLFHLHLTTLPLCRGRRNDPPVRRGHPRCPTPGTYASASLSHFVFNLPTQFCWHGCILLN